MPTSTPPKWPLLATGLVATVGIAASLAGLSDPLAAAGGAVAALALACWLFEAIPPHAVTLGLLGLCIVWLGPLQPAFRAGPVLGAAADPVLALFLGGLCLGAAASRHGLDDRVANAVLRAARGRARRLVVLAALATGLLAMWLSGVAAAALMLAAFRPLVQDLQLRRACLLAIAVGANLGGMGTPVGAGPNALAMAAAPSLTFLQWMGLAVPLTLGALAVAATWLVFVHRVRDEPQGPALAPSSPRNPWQRPEILVACVAAACIVGWVGEPLHGIPAAAVALLTCAVLFGSGLLGRQDLGQLDWSTLLLIAGGITLGRVLDKTGLAATVLATLDLGALPAAGRLAVYAGLAALLSALMSNTGAVAMLLPMAALTDPGPVTAVVVALASSFGMPLPISTPANALMAGEGSVRTRDFLVVGLPVLVGGVAVVVLTGPAVLAWWGVR